MRHFDLLFQLLLHYFHDGGKMAERGCHNQSALIVGKSIRLLKPQWPIS